MLFLYQIKIRQKTACTYFQHKYANSLTNKKCVLKTCLGGSKIILFLRSCLWTIVQIFKAQLKYGEMLKYLFFCLSLCLVMLPLFEILTINFEDLQF